jgi:uncharacterized protein YndB with AHSA1/START domain
MTDGRATTSQKKFRMERGVAIEIAAPSEQIWALRTGATGFPRWSSTVQSLDGEIALGQKLAVRVPLAPKRVFELEVVAFVPHERMVWCHDAMPRFRGARTLRLASRGNGVELSMGELFAGSMLPMIKGALSDFAPSCEHYALDLERGAERN